MKAFTIAELLVYDPTRLSPKRKPIEIDIQEAKIVAYCPAHLPLEQKCNTVGMAEGVYGFCHALLAGRDTQADNQDGQRGWQTVALDTCTLILSEVEESLWIFVKLEHAAESRYYRLGEKEENYYQDQSFSDDICRLFMEQLYGSFRMFYGNLRGWVFRERFAELQSVLSGFVARFEEIFGFEGRLDTLSFLMRDLRMIPLDVNSTLKFSYFKNVLQSQNSNIAHLAVYAFGVLAYTSLAKTTTHLLSKYLFSTGEPYLFADHHKVRMNSLPEMPRHPLSLRFGTLYNSRSLGFEEGADIARVSVGKSQGADLLGLGGEGNEFELFEMFVEEEELPVRVSFYAENNMYFVTLYKRAPALNEIIFQNRFYHDNADKFVMKISESIPGLLKPNDPYRFIFHNTATFTGKSTVRDWKNSGHHIRNTIDSLTRAKEGVVATSTPFGYWVYGVHRFSRILILLVPTELPLAKVEDFVTKMTREYFSRAYV